MNRTRWIALAWILLSSGISILWGSSMDLSLRVGMADFKAVYYGSRCLLQHADPYNESEFERVYSADGGDFPTEPAMLLRFRRAVLVSINLPTSLLLIAPLAMLGWGPAHALWLLFLAVSLIAAGFLMWDAGASYAPGLSLFLICMALANSEIIFISGNTAGIAIGLCAVAVWCFLKQRFELVGVLCMAVSLAIKPHDTGLVWLFFLLAGGVYRKRALQTLVVTAMLCLPAILWVSTVAPHWIPELKSNLAATSAHGDLNDPGPASIAFRNVNMVVDLQSVISIIRDDPRIYNPVTWLMCGALLLAGALRTVRSQCSLARAWIAIAAVAPLTMLVTYHRSYDAKLLLLGVPACAMLWAEGGRIGRLALLTNAAGIVLTGDIPSAILIILARHFQINPVGFSGKLLTILVMRPAPLALLAMGIFYLWVYMRHVPGEAAPAEQTGPGKTPIALAQS